MRKVTRVDSSVVIKVTWLQGQASCITFLFSSNLNDVYMTCILNIMPL